MKVWRICLMASLICSPVIAQSTQPSVAATFEPTSKPASRPNPLADPVSAVQYFFQLIHDDNFTAIRSVNLDQSTVSEMRAQCANVTRAFRAGFTVATVDSHQVGNVAIVICRLVDPDGRDQPPFSMVVVQRFDDWKVEMGAVNPRRFTPVERANLEKVAAWRTGRLAELRATTQPATAPAVRTGD